VTRVGQYYVPGAYWRMVTSACQPCPAGCSRSVPYQSHHFIVISITATCEPGTYKTFLFAIHEDREEQCVRLSTRGATVAGGLLWGAALLLVGLINLASPAYGSKFVQVMGSVYLFFHVSRTFGDVLSKSQEASLIRCMPCTRSR
jgi:hypothetical protein